jgi:hypothetical protein
MNKKSIFAWVMSVILFSLLFWYSLVFAWTWIFDNSASIVFKLSDNIYLDSLWLRNTKIVFKSGDDLKNYDIKSECEIFSELSHNKWDYYTYEIKFFDNDCDKSNFILVNDKSEIKISFKLNLITEFNILSKLLDIKTTRLVQLKNTLNKKIVYYSDYKKYDKDIEENYYVFLVKNRLLNESIYNRNLIDNIITKREEKYSVPVIWYDMPITWVKIPNSWRWYREDYTDWIHHGWDIDWEFWEQVVALDDWIIIRVVSEFEYSDLDAIKRADDLSYEEKLVNLDILRWNQVWLKTMSGDLVMYSHLNDIFSNVKTWEVVKKNQPLWTIWITWVPDINYKDYHLHFVVHKNPFSSTSVWLYDYEDYMKWDWLFKWKSKDFILKNQLNYFES